MECEICHEAIATVHLTDVINNVKKEIHLCEDCAEKRGATIKSYMNKVAPVLPEIQAAQLASTDLGESENDDTPVGCPGCEISYRTFRSNGKFGCPKCYTAFGRHVIQLLEKIHQKVQHVGKMPLRTNRDEAAQNEIKHLREALRGAIEMEEYEKAANIRDRIYGLEGRVEKG